MKIYKCYFIKFVQDLSKNGELVYESQVPSKRNYMVIKQTESNTWYSVYTKPLFAYDAYFRIDVSLRVDKYGKKTFQFGIRAVPLKTTSMDIELKLHVSTWGKIIGQETVTMQNHDGSKYEYKTYDFLPCEQFKIVLGDIKIDAYDRKNYETLDFNVALPSKNTYKKSGKVSGDYKWYKNFSPKRNLKGRASYDSTQIFFNLSKNFR